MDTLKAKSTIINGLIWVVQRVTWGSSWAYERLSGIHADLDQQYYSLRSRHRFEQERERWEEPNV